MITRYKQNKIGVHVDGQKVFYFYMDSRSRDDERKIAGAILGKVQRKIVADALMAQLHGELNTTCRTELVKEVYIDVSDVYYPTGNGSSPRPSYGGKDAINMDFSTDFVIGKVIRDGCNDYYEGFTSNITLGRFSRKAKKFTEISNSMLGKCELM